MDSDPRRPYGGDEEDEPERHPRGRGQPPAKKPLAEFLAEFESRLRETPGEPATDAHRELEARAEGARHPHGYSAPPSLPAVEASNAPEPPPVEPATAIEAGEAPAPLDTPTTGRRLRGRRHRRHRRR